MNTTGRPVIYANTASQVPPLAPILVMDGNPENHGNAIPLAPLRRVLEESSYDALSAAAAQPLNLGPLDPVPLVAQAALILSAMAMELGVILRIHMRTPERMLQLDAERLRRAVNALLIHLLSISSPGSTVTVNIKNMENGTRAENIMQFLSSGTIVTEECELESEAYWDTRLELSVARRMISQQGGRLHAERREDGRFMYEVWFSQ